MTSPTRQEKILWLRMAAHGCVACKQDGFVNLAVEIHHLDGRTKEGAHRRVIPLCAGHHRDGAGLPGLVAVHPWKARFAARYGAVEDLWRAAITKAGGDDG